MKSMQGPTLTMMHNGRPVEMLGFYEKRMGGVVTKEIDSAKVAEWMKKGAQLSVGAKKIIESKKYSKIEIDAKSWKEIEIKITNDAYLIQKSSFNQSISYLFPNISSKNEKSTEDFVFSLLPKAKQEHRQLLENLKMPFSGQREKILKEATKEGFFFFNLLIFT